MDAQSSGSRCSNHVHFLGRNHKVHDNSHCNNYYCEKPEENFVDDLGSCLPFLFLFFFTLINCQGVRNCIELGDNLVHFTLHLRGKYELLRSTVRRAALWTWTSAFWCVTSLYGKVRWPAVCNHTHWSIFSFWWIFWRLFQYRLFPKDSSENFKDEEFEGSRHLNWRVTIINPQHQARDNQWTT